jgi:hypothetical protein
MASRRYGSFTPARRAALKKAQLASARKRSARKKKIAGAIGAAVALGTVGALAGSRINSRVRTEKHASAAKHLRLRHTGKKNINERYARRVIDAQRVQRQRDMIPLYNGKSRFGSGNVEKTVQKNQKLRRKGHLPSVHANRFGVKHLVR